MTSLCKKMRSAAHRFVKGAVHIIAPDERSRKKAVSTYYAIRWRAYNLAKREPSFNAEELLSWRRTMRLKIEYSIEVYRGNSFYGAGLAMREYARLNTPLKACIEHGLYLGEYTNPVECGDSGLPAVVTFGPARAEHIRSVSDKPVLMVGPYIAYAKDYLDKNEAARAKRMIGRTLLAFPSHSTDYVEKRFDTSDYIEHLQERKREEGFDTVLVSLYFSDIIKGSANLYERAGFTVVTCGYREDSRFLRRLKSLICLADETSSNSVGTHVGYCAYFGKPHLIYRQTCEAIGITRQDTKADFSEKNERSSAEESDEIAKAFAVRTEAATNSQLEVCDKYWGFQHIKTAENMAKLFNLLDAIDRGEVSDEVIETMKCVNSRNVNDWEKEVR
ncbi:hypothetical protein [Candidatus Collinsella stercoripullorum]|uniref:hypothetical protein n=1 Tax=Candidatus Collinsella stercoripullorum TaxID=2838522 RepID=UPI0022E295E4|nr:hypothetical protein [Candidatus Collinsella stercoripullorum]